MSDKTKFTQDDLDAYRTLCWKVNEGIETQQDNILIDEFEKAFVENQDKAEELDDLKKRFVVIGNVVETMETLQKTNTELKQQINNKTFYLAKNKEGKQLAFFNTEESARTCKDVHSIDIWRTDENTGQIYPSNASIGIFEIVPKKGES